MKLISCYIENFGGLSQYALEFGEGLTVIQEPNGFGKTTLAEFLRAMFYGFPRKAKTLDKSRRQKYTPWGGGKFGGNLVFEHEGIRYRLERTFGATPKGDSFALIDLETGRKSARFSEEIGLELFRLDADSFERSTYLPQLREGLTLNTNAIQAKLGDLVEDTGDINNFDKAVKALREKRSSFIPYRGSGGTVAAAAAEITRVQQELDTARRQKEELEHCKAQTEALEAEIAGKKAEMEALRKQWEQASETAADRARFEELTAQYQTVTAELDALTARYPLDIPGEAEITEARKLADDLAVLEARQVTTPADLDAQRTVEEKRERFQEYLPDEEELETIRQDCQRYDALLTKRASLGLTEGERKRYAVLDSAFGSGALNEEMLDTLAERNRDLLRQRAALETMALPEEDCCHLEELEKQFPCGLPSTEEMERQRQNVQRCEALRQENDKLKARMAEPALGRQSLLILGAAAAVLGAVLLALQLFLVGAVVLAAGIALAVVSCVRQKKRQATARARLWARISENEQQIASVEREIREVTGGRPLDEFQRERDELLRLKAKLRTLNEKRGALETVIRQMELDLKTCLAQYVPQVTDFEKAISDLRLALGQYRDLREKKTRMDGEISRLDAQITASRRMLTGYFERYFADVSAERFTELLANLSRDAADYARAKAQTTQWEIRKDAHRQELEQCQRALAAFFPRFGLTQEPDVRGQLQRIYDDFRSWEKGVLSERQLAAQLRQFPETSTVGAELDTLARQSEELNGEYEALTEALMTLRQSRRELQNQAERIPELSDELERWQERKNADCQKSRILDDAVDFLHQAHENLTTSYLGPIRASFGQYLARMTGDGNEKAVISSDLDVQLERLGQTRELGYFSAGQTDTVMLCMRLALVDALFPRVKPFVILDDPFVNLDDRRVAEALDLLKDLSKDRQIIYMTCSTSRMI